MYWIDSHAHLTDEKLLPHLEEIVQRARIAKVSHILNICTDPPSLREGVILEQSHPWIRNAGAIPPHDVETLGESCFPIFEKAAKEGQLAAIGETGLDYYYEHSKKAIQKDFLIRYLHLAQEVNLPIIFHCRGAFEDLFSITDAEYSKKGPAVLHCFTGTLEEAKECVRRGWFLSFSGILTFKKSQALREVAREIPLDSILIETDAPYLAPQSKRGSLNEPAFIGETGECLALLKGVSPDELGQKIANNTEKLFFSKKE